MIIDLPHYPGIRKRIPDRRSMRAAMTIILILMSITFRQASAQYDYDYYGGNGIYFGVGTSMSSYFGGYFGQAYQMRVLSYGYDDYYYDYYDYDYSNYYDDDLTLWSPYQFDVVAGVMLNEFTALESQVSFLFHLDGRVDPQFETGTVGERDYLDRNDYAYLYAMPVSLCLKLIAAGDDGNSIYIKGGYATQYTSEQYDRIREFYYYSGIYEYSNDLYLGTVKKEEWLSGFRVGMGIQYSLGGYLGGLTEFEYSYFNINPSNATALALDRAPEAQLFSLKTVLFVIF